MTLRPNAIPEIKRRATRTASPPRVIARSDGVLRGVVLSDARIYRIKMTDISNPANE